MLSHAVSVFPRFVVFCPVSVSQLLVVTAAARLLKFSASNGQLLNEVCPIKLLTCTPRYHMKGHLKRSRMTQILAS